ncbi:RNA polymerase sigma-70 factor [Dyadobacter psychrotolerans]|uniref:RNA polymerase sigma-70 factor n=1 Tax=Dyadobacter psychrotolerans TaxID=2541721 RepID=UPI001404F934|nr:RNA polymerase sigma-70 factor [Dyadobacter psychrotolerans]
MSGHNEHIGISIVSINRDTFEQAYNLYWKELYLTCLRYLEDEEQAKEIVQEVFKSIWEKREEIEIKTTLKNYLFGVTKMKIFEFYRVSTVREKYTEYSKNENQQLHFTTENEVIYKELLGNVNKLIERLPTRCQEIFKLSREEGLSNKAISSLLLISEKAVEKNMTKALASLRQGISFFL